ncbi:MAG: rhomboid family intramembrane serine protease [Bacteroidia bacterium]
MSEERDIDKILNGPYSFDWRAFPYYGFVSIMAINIVVYVAMIIDGVSFFYPTNDELLRWGANFGPYTLKDEWWRLFTCEFVHIGFGHLFANMVSLIYIGILLEPLIGTLRFVTVYMLATVAAALLSVWWNGYAIGAGASGATLGMYGMMLMFSIVARKMFAPGELGAFFIWAFFVIVFNLLYGLKDGIDNSAHLGGIFYGMFAALVFYPSYRKKESFSVTLLNDVVLIVISVGIFVYAYQHIPKGMAYYDDVMEQFDINQDKALLVLRQLDNDSVYYEKTDYYIQRIEEEGIKSWDRNITALAELNNLPENYGTRVELLMKYSLLRKEACEVVIKNLKDNRGPYINEVGILYDSMDVVVKELDRVTFIIDNGYAPELDSIEIAPGVKATDIDLE